MIAIVDYDAGNLKSVEKAVLSLGYECAATKSPDDVLNAQKIILPGVGAFGDAMARLEKRGLAKAIKGAAAKKKPILGICLGLQLLFEESEESLGAEGLGLLKGSISAFPKKSGYKIPHMGWNSIEIKKSGRLLDGLVSGTYVYFVHSYCAKAKNKNDVAATALYSTDFDAAIEKDNIFATQFHPEKSGDAGLRILRNFCEIKAD